MAQLSRRAGLTGSVLVRLLARLTDTDVPESKQGFADRLSHWLGWSDAISLSAALVVPTPASPSGAPAAAELEASQCARVRVALENAIDEEMRGLAREQPSDFPPFRRRYHARQQAMATSIAPLRERLRQTLAARSPAMARLAGIDAVMEQVLGEQEHRLLGTVPTFLEKYFKRLRQDAAPADGPAVSDVDAWRATFSEALRSVWLAELEIRLQPVDALVDALRACETTPQ
ncbi:MAG: DUF3348 family protein [Variovorax sp.]|nr:MAG: DUF3348 family protein [Variovorax sp.]